MYTEFGITDIVLSGSASGPTTSDVDGNLARFAGEVIPHFERSLR
jgi:hypothetical protein